MNRTLIMGEMRDWQEAKKGNQFEGYLKGSEAGAGVVPPAGGAAGAAPNGSEAGTAGAAPSMAGAAGAAGAGSVACALQGGAQRCDSMIRHRKEDGINLHPRPLPFMPFPVRIPRHGDVTYDVPLVCTTTETDS